MFGILSSLKNIVRYKKKSIIILIISTIIMLFISYYIFLLDDCLRKINYIYDNTTIEVTTEYKNGSCKNKFIPYDYMKNNIEVCPEIEDVYYQSLYDVTLDYDVKLNDKNEIEGIVQLYATTDINRELLFSKYNTKITYLEGISDRVFSENRTACIVSRKLFNENKWSLGDSINVYSPNYEIDPYVDTMKFTIVGVYDIPEKNTLTEGQLKNNTNAIYCAFYPFAKNFRNFYKTRTEYGDYGVYDMTVGEATYVLKDSSRVEEFRQYAIKNSEFYCVATTIKNLNSYKLMIHDEKLKQMLGGIKSIAFFLKIALPFVISILITIGFTISYLITQNRVNDIALMRIMGIKRLKVFLIILHEMILPCSIGGIISILLSQIVYRNWFVELPDIQFNLLLLISYILIFSIGASVALSLILKLKPIQVLTKKE